MRKFGQILFFLGLGVAMLFGHDLLLWVVSLIHGAAPVTDGLGNATGAEVVAQQQAGGWAQAGAVTSKLITAGGAFFFMGMLRWLNRQITHPAPTKWAKERYSAAFEALPEEEKFTVYRGIGNADAWVAIGALLFAALVQ